MDGVESFLFLGITATAAQAEVTYYHTDFQGSPAAITNEAGGVVSRTHYRPFGDSFEGIQQDVGYTGHLHDAELNLVYMQARYYDPVIGRFYSNDPVGFTSSNPHSFNRYSYAKNNPYKYVDPDGRETSFAIRLDNRIERLYSGEITAQQYSAEMRAEGYGAVAGLSLISPIDEASIVVAAVGKVGINAYRAVRAKSAIKVTNGAARVPGRVQTRINLSNDGMEHTLSRHLNPAKSGNKSQFTLSESELRSLLGAKSTVQAPAQALESGNFARTITTNRTVGNLAEKMGGGSTNTFTVITDKFGNLQTAYPGGL